MNLYEWLKLEPSICKIYTPEFKFETFILLILELINGVCKTLLPA